MVDNKSNRKPVTLYLDERHHDWWQSLPNNSRSDLFNTLVDMYRAGKDFTKHVNKSIAHISSTKVHGPMSERFFIRFQKQSVVIVEKAAKKLNMSPTDYARETLIRYSKQILGKDIQSEGVTK